ncbi:transposase [Acinetobacter baumannii]|nr:transposase [Acinetobacter baumannii]MBD0477542.1 transposase [Acinetobacter baumannii]MCG6639932.1 transposase [Acinetobacter baumannii]QJP32901.1 transposase [Acinetobacter baumannii]TPU40979.1 transposase [Acinetobacter baumannii]
MAPLYWFYNDLTIKAKLAEWEAFYNYARPHAAMNGKIPL